MKLHVLNLLRCLRIFPLLGLFAALPSFGDETVARAAGGWFAADARAVKDTTWEGGAIVGGETALVLQSSPNAWGAAGGGDCATITWQSTSGNGGTVAEATTAETVVWTPEAKSGTNTLTFVSGSVIKTAQFAVVRDPLPDGGPYKETVDGIEWTFMVANGEASVSGASPATEAVTVPSVLGYRAVTGIGPQAFYGEAGLTNVTVAAGVTNIGERAFFGCTGLEALGFYEDAPIVGADAFAGVAETCVVSAAWGTKGWDDDGDGTWQGLTLEYRDAPPKVLFEVGDYGERTGGGKIVQYVEIGQKAELPTVAADALHTFLGWFTEETGGTKLTENPVVTGSVTYYAQYGKADLGVDYVLGGHWTSGTTASGEGMVFAGLDETAEGGLSVRLKSEDDCETWIETTVAGEMWISFDWKTSCETFEYLELDRIEFSIDGRRQDWANGETDWTNRVFAVRGEGEHTIRFAYVKDESEFSGEDSVWVANVATAPKTAVATPVIGLAATYATESTTCTITTETEGATIRYKLDYYGDESEWFEYAGPFEVIGSKTVVAYAVKPDYYDSEAVRASTERTMPWTLAECVNAPHLDFTTGGDGEWKRTTATTHDGTAAVRSGEIATGKQTWVKVQTLGPGTISFWWKADSAYYKKTLLDYATFKVDGKEIAKIGGAADWVRVTHDVTGTGLHTYLWTYTKTAQTAMGEDCVWLDEVTWTADTTGGVVVPTTVTGGKAVTVGTDWKDSELDAKFGDGTRTKFEKRYGADLTAALLKPSGKRDVHGNARYVWQDNVMGTDPTDKASELVTSVEVVDGVPVITWDPDLGAARVYKIWGSENLHDWQWPTNALHRFFKVTVEME